MATGARRLLVLVGAIALTLIGYESLARADDPPTLAPLADEAPVYVALGFKAPTLVVKDCIAANVRLPETFESPIPSRVTLKVPVKRDGTPGEVQILDAKAPPSVTSAIRAAVAACRWNPGLDAEGKAKAMWVVLPLHFKSDLPPGPANPVREVWPSEEPGAPGLPEGYTPPRLVDKDCIVNHWRELIPRDERGAQVVTKFVVYASGRVGDFRVLRGVEEERAVEVLRDIVTGCEWVPAKDANGNARSAGVVFPIRVVP